MPRRTKLPPPKLSRLHRAGSGRDSRLDRLVIGYREMGLTVEQIAQLLNRSVWSIQRREKEAWDARLREAVAIIQVNKLRQMFLLVRFLQKLPKPKPAKRRKTLLFGD